MIVTFWKGIFVADSLDEKGALRKAGFELHEPTTCHLRDEGGTCKACRAKIGRRWWSNRIEAATRLKQFCNERALRVMKNHLELLKRSRATDAEISIPAPPGLSYLPFQKAGVSYALQRKDTLVADEMGLGKQQPNDTPVATPNGWRTIGDLKKDDLIIGSDGRPTTVMSVHPQGIKPSFRVTFSDFSSVEAGPEHLWTVAYRRGGKIWATMTLTTEDLRLRPMKDRLSLAKTKLYLPMLTGPIQFNLPLLQLPMDPYVLGCIVANGYVDGTSAVLSCNAHDLDHIRERIGKTSTPLGKTRTYGFASHGSIVGAISIIRDMDLNVLSSRKFIPKLYQLAAPADRISLLQGLMDGDGSITPERNRVVYHTTSPQLAEDVRELVQGLGGISSIRTYDRTWEHKPIEFQVRMKLPTWVTPFSTPRKSERYKPGSHALPCRTVLSVDYVRDVESTCIRVDSEDHLYITRDCILTHNSVEALGFMNCLKPKRTIIVCPATLIFNWRNEAEKWLVGFDYETCIVETKRDEIPEREGIVVIVNYEKLGGDSPLMKSIMKLDWDIGVFDEAQYVKNPDAARSKAIIGPHGVATKVKRSLFLTGTPIENYPKEIWPIAAFLAPAKFGNFWDFALRYCSAHQEDRKFFNPKTKETYWKKVWVTEGASNLGELQQRLRTSVMVRRVKRDVLPELPPKRRQLIVLQDPKKDWSKDPRFHRWKEIYEKEYEEASAKLEVAKTEEEYRSLAKTLDEITGIPFTEMSEIRHEVALAKLPLCIKYIDEILAAGTQNLVIFAHHRDVLDELANKYAADCVVVHGGTPSKGPNSREEAVKAFQEGRKKIFIGQTRAAGVGITLTAADTVVFVEVDWVPGVVTQCEDRLCRIGQKKMVHVIHTVLGGTMEVNMIQKLIKKQDVIDKALDKMPEIKLRKVAS